ncbi:MAG TPA: hypothetical protein VHU19_14410 [Pyrinomonadaceae bacterium]|jgi:hypothetical protein|nr:hypothetical protein [Pyrinomonadaceae bacterium]
MPDAHERRISFVEQHEEALLHKVFSGFLTTFVLSDLNAAAELVGQHAQDHGMSFHEALFALCFVLDNSGHLFHWKRYDLDAYTPEV